MLKVATKNDKFDKIALSLQSVKQTKSWWGAKQSAPISSKHRKYSGFFANHQTFKVKILIKS